MTRLGTTGDYRMQFHAPNGTIRTEFPCNQALDLGWGRQLSEVSKATLSGRTAASYDLIKDVMPWSDMLSIWRGTDFVWCGFVTIPRYTRSGWTINAFDVAHPFLWTRVPLSKKWSDTDPVDITAEIWNTVNNLQGIQRITKNVVTVPSATSYTFAVSKDAKMTNQVIEDLVKMGVAWTVIGAQPLVVPALRTPALTFPKFGLRDCDFGSELEVSIEGTRYFNDVRLQGANWAETVVTDDGTGLRRQQLVSIDKLTGVANIQRAARQQAARSSVLRRTVTVPSGATLDPNVEIGINELQPGIVLPVYTDLLGGITDWQRLDAVEVKVTAGKESVGVTLSTSAASLGEE